MVPLTSRLPPCANVGKESGPRTAALHIWTPCDCWCRASCASASPARVGLEVQQKLVQGAHSASVACPIVIRRSQGDVLAELDFAELQNRWKHMLDTDQQTQACMCPLWTPLAKAIVCRKWLVDVTTLLFRDFKQRWRPPLLPPRFAVLAFLREARLHNVQANCSAVHGQVVERVARRGPDNSVAPIMFSSHIVIAALRASYKIRSVRNALTKEKLQTCAALV